MNRPTVIVSIETRRHLGVEEVARPFFSSWFDQFPELAPEFAQNYEPIRRKVGSSADCVEVLESGPFLWKRRSPIKSRGGLFDGSPHFCSSFRLRAEWSDSVSWEQFFDLACSYLDPEFGYVHVVTEAERLNPGTSIEKADHFLDGAAAMKVIERIGIPNIGWKTVFGKKFAETFNIATAGEGPLHAVKITSQISDVLKDFEGFEAKRRLARHALGL